MEKTLEDLLMDMAQGDAPAVDPNIVEGEPAVVVGEEEIGGGANTPDVVTDDNGQTTEPPVEAQGAEGGSEGDTDPIVLEEEEEEEVIIELPDDVVEEVEPAISEFMTEVQSIVGEDVKNAEQLKEFVDGLKSEVTTLKEQVSVNPLENIPEQLKEAVELANDGKGDYLELLKITSVDYTKLDPATLAEQEIRQYFYTSEGNFDEDGFVDYIDNVPEKELEIRGKQRIGQLVQEQNNQKAQFFAKQEQHAQIRKVEIEKAVHKLDNVAGFKVKESDKPALVAKLVKNNVFDSNSAQGVTDFEGAAKNQFIIDNFDKMVNYLKTTTRNDFKKQVIKEMGNQTVGTPADKTVHTPELSGDPLDMMIDAAKQTSQANSIQTFFDNNNK